MNLFTVSVQQGLLYTLLALGVYITFRILNTPDLTADGSYALGLAVSGICSAQGHPLLGLLLAAATGMLAGGVTGFLQTKAGIHPVLAGILTMFGLQSVNLFIMGAPNISLLNSPTVFSLAQGLLPGVPAAVLRMALPAVFAIAAILLLQWFFSTQLGLSIRATGSNEDMVRASSINVDAVKMIGFALANGFVALTGALIAQFQGSADLNAGIGTVTIGLASLIIGEVICGRRSLFIGLVSACVGAVGYRLILGFALQLNIPAHAFKLLSAVIIGLALSLPAIKKAYLFQKAKKGGGGNA